MAPRKLENMSSLQRRLTPYRFAVWLVMRVVVRHGTDTVPVLWVDSKSEYYRLWPLADCWGIGRNARLYGGPYPIVAHPPCGSWGKYRAVSRQPKEDGIIAVDMVRRFGGVVEQPVGSTLFKEHGGRGRIEVVNQFCYGHEAIKPTVLLWVD